MTAETASRMEVVNEKGTRTACARIPLRRDRRRQRVQGQERRRAPAAVMSA